jgi:diguanylate cyclase
MVESEPEYLKIDRFFVHGAYSHPHRAAVLESIARLGMKLGARVIGEGVEDVADVFSLREIGIDLIQGNLMAAPLTRDELVAGRWLDCGTRPLVPLCPGEDLSTCSNRSHPSREQPS